MECLVWCLADGWHPINNCGLLYKHCVGSEDKTKKGIPEVEFLKVLQWVDSFPTCIIEMKWYSIFNHIVQL